MVDVVAVHGINLHRSSRKEMHDLWTTAIKEGLDNIRSPLINEISVECAFYGHEYNAGKSVGFGARFSIVDLNPGFEQDLVMAIAESIGDDCDNSESKLYLPGTLQRALASIQRSKIFEGSESFLISFVKQVHRYLFDKEFQERVHAEFMHAYESSSPSLVIAHSLGSIVAYNWLRKNNPSEAPALLTFGSPLGLPAIMRQLGNPPNQDKPLEFVRSWTNVASCHDGVAMVKELATSYHPDINDQPCKTSRNGAHSAVNYLKNVVTARAIDSALS